MTSAARTSAELVLGGATSWWCFSTLQPMLAIAASISSACPARILTAAPGSSRPWCRCGGRDCRLVVGVGVGREFDGVELEAGVVGIGLERTSSKTKNSASGPKKMVSPMPHRLDHSPRPSWRCRAGRGCRARRSVGSSTSQNSDQRGLGEERIDARGAGPASGHVGLVDRLPAGDRGAVEHLAFGEGVFVRSSTSKVTCCHLPRGSVKRKSTYFTSLSLIIFRHLWRSSWNAFPF
jgi:hypothetical protein